MGRKIFTGILIALSTILLLASVAGIGATWIYRSPLTDKTVTRLKEIDAELIQAQTALENAKTELERTLRLVDSAQTTLDSLSKELGLAKGLFGEVDTTLDKQLIPSLQASRDKIDQAKSALEGLRETLKKINSIPFLNLTIPGDDTLANLISAADSIDMQIVQAEEVVKKVSTFTSDLSYLTGGDLTETRQHIQSLLDDVNQYDQKVTVWRAQVENLITVAPTWITRTAIGLTVFLLWFGLSQFGLFLHALALWRGGDPLLVLRRP